MPKGVHTGLFDDSGLFMARRKVCCTALWPSGVPFQPAIEKVCLWFAALDVLLQALGDVRTEHHIAAFIVFRFPDMDLLSVKINV
jgi:hypothetical protein